MSAGKSTNEGTRRSRLLVTTSPRRTRFATALLAALLALTLALASRAEAYVYWNSGSNLDTIGRANLDGSGTNNDFIVLPPFHYRCALAVDERYIYWTNSRQATIGRANLDGTDVDERFISDANPSCGLAVDGSHIYWPTSTASDGGSPFGRGVIARTNLDGTDVDRSFVTGLDFPMTVAVGPEHVFWADGHPGDPFYTPVTIGRANRDGTGVERRFIESGSAAMAVDGSHIYWSVESFSRSEGSSYNLFRARLDGTGVEALGDWTDERIGRLAVDNTHIYWCGSGSIGRAKRDGTRANHEFITGIGDGCGEVVVDALGPRPSNKFSFGQVKKNRKQGTAKLTVKVPGSGDLHLARTKKVKAKNKGADAKGKVKLPIKPRRKAKQKLAAKGKAKVKAEVSYTPDGGTPKTQSKKIKLVKRR